MTNENRKRLTPEELTERRAWLENIVKEREENLTKAGYSKEMVDHIVKYTLGHRGYNERHEGNFLTTWMCKLMHICKNKTYSFNKNDREKFISELVEFLKSFETETPIKFEELFLEKRGASAFIAKCLSFSFRNENQSRYFADCVLDALCTFPDEFLVSCYHKERPEDQRNAKTDRSNSSSRTPQKFNNPYKSRVNQNASRVRKPGSQQTAVKSEGSEEIKGKASPTKQESPAPVPAKKHYVEKRNTDQSRVERFKNKYNKSNQKGGDKPSRQYASPVQKGLVAGAFDALLVGEDGTLAIKD